MEKRSTKIGAVVGIVLAIAVMLVTPPGNLTTQSMMVLGVLIWAVIYWAFGIMNDMVTALIMGVLFVSMAKVPFDVVFGGFVNSALWLVFAALLFTAALNKTGLIRRISLWALKVLPGTYVGQLAALYLTSFFVVGPIVPSSVAKLAIPTPMALGVAESMGLEDNSKGTAGLALGVFVSSGVLGGMAFMTGMAPNIAYIGALPDAIKNEVTWLGWTIAALPSVLLVAVVMFLMIWKQYGKGVKPVSKEHVTMQLNEMGKLKKEERNCGIVIAATFLLWLTGSWTKLAAHEVALAAVAVLFITGVLNQKDISKLNWSLWVYLGIIINLGGVLGSVGINDWLISILTPVIEPLSGNKAVLLIAIFGVILFVRMIIPSQVTAGIMLMLMLSPIATKFGINPFIIVIIMAGVGNHWLLPHLNVAYLSQFSMLEGRAYTHGQARKLSFAFLGLCLLGVVISIPYWYLLGYLY